MSHKGFSHVGFSTLKGRRSYMSRTGKSGSGPTTMTNSHLGEPIWLDFLHHGRSTDLCLGVPSRTAG